MITYAKYINFNQVSDYCESDHSVSDHDVSDCSISGCTMSDYSVSDYVWVTSITSYSGNYS